MRASDSSMRCAVGQFYTTRWILAMVSTDGPSIGGVFDPEQPLLGT